MAGLIQYEVAKYLVTLATTNEICSHLGERFVFGQNLFVSEEPANVGTCLSIHTYSGEEPNTDGWRQTAELHIRLKTANRQKNLRCMQALINELHLKQNFTASVHGQILAKQSNPMIWEYPEGGQFVVSVANFKVMYVKV